jgi:hypothetical protein
MLRVWIVELRASPRVLDKLGARGITLEEVSQAVAFFSYDEATWHEDQERGRRLFCTGRTVGGKPLLIILGPDDLEDGIWHIRSAWENR